MISFIKNNLIRFILAVLLITILSLNYLGFCYNQSRFLTDEEKLIIAVKDILAKETSMLGQLNRLRLLDKNDKRRLQLERNLPGEPIPYRNIDEFFALNPRVCSQLSQMTVETKQSMA